MKAIICAAGDSKRMSDITKSVPKPLLPLGSKSIIENLLDAVAVEPVDEIIILVGYLADQIKEKIGNDFKGIPVSYITNETYSTTNNMYSIYLAKDKIDDDIVFVSGDVYIEPEIGRDFIRNEYADSVIIDDNPKHFTSDDPVKVTIKDSIVAIDKKLSKDNVNGVAIGIYKFSSGLIQKYFKIAADFIEKGHIQYGYIEPIKILINQNKIMPFYIKGKWMDIDTIEEYETAKNLIG